MATLLAIRTPDVLPPTAAPGPARRRLRTEIAEGLSFVVRHPILRHVVACTGTSNLFGGMLTALQVVFLVRVLHVPPALVGLTFAVASAGGVLRGALAKPLSARIGSARIIWFSFLAFGLPMLLAPLAQPGWRVALFLIVLFASSFQGVVYSVTQLSYRQAVCPPELLGWVNAAARWIVWGTIPLGALIGSALGPAIGVHTTLWIAVIGDWGAGFLVYFSPLRRMRDVVLTPTARSSFDHNRRAAGMVNDTTRLQGLDGPAVVAVEDDRSGGPVVNLITGRRAGAAVSGCGTVAVWVKQ